MPVSNPPSRPRTQHDVTVQGGALTGDVTVQGGAPTGDVTVQGGALTGDITVQGGAPTGPSQYRLPNWVHDAVSFKIKNYT